MESLSLIVNDIYFDLTRPQQRELQHLDHISN